MIKWHIITEAGGNYESVGNTIEEAFPKWVTGFYGENPTVTQTVLPDPTPTEKVSVELELLWKKAWEWAYSQLAAQDQVVVGGWYTADLLNEAGMQGYRDLITWQDQLFTGVYADAKQAIVLAQQWVEPNWSEWPACPHDFYFFYANRIA